MQYLFRFKIILLLFVLGLTHSPIASQTYEDAGFNYLGFQQKPYYFGISLAMNTSRFKPFRSSDFMYSDEIYVIESLSGPGFNLGIIGNLKLGNEFDFRFLPSLSFAERTLAYTNKQEGVESLKTRKIESVFVEMPFHLRYKSKPYKDMRLFVIAGMKYGFDVASDSRSRQADSLVKISPTDFSLEYGAGVQLFFPFFIFSPEIKFSNGIGNTLIYNGQLKESTVIDKILSRTITFSFNFEG
jgi:hypothetical protein